MHAHARTQHKVGLPGLAAGLSGGVLVRPRAAEREAGLHESRGEAALGRVDARGLAHRVLVLARRAVGAGLR